MKTKFIIGIILFSTICHAQIIPKSEEQKIENSDYIVEGKIIAQNSFETNKSIFTDNVIEIYNVLKGKLNSSTITIETIGGKVGNKILYSYPNNNFNVNDYGIFFLNKKPNESGFKVSFMGQSKISLYNKLTKNQIKRINKNINYLREITLHNSSKDISSLQITGLNPSIVHAGIGETITITGTDFGNSQAPNGMNVWTVSAGDPSTFIRQPRYTTVSWTDTEIVFKVSSDVGSGIIKVSNGIDIIESTNTIVVDYAIGDSPNFVEEDLFTINLPALDNGGIIFTRNTNFSNENALNRTREALEQWTCETGMKWSLNETNSTTNTQNQDDNINTIYYSNLGTGVAGITYISLELCDIFGRIFIKDLDIAIANNVNFNYLLNTTPNNMIDYYSVILHELGHARNLKHVIDINSPMHYLIDSGQEKRLLDNNTITAGLWIQNDSTTNIVCGNPLMENQDCSTAFVDDFESNTIEIYPNPILNKINITVQNKSIVSIFDITGKILMKNKLLLTGNNQLDLSTYNTGVYYLKIKNKNSDKVIIKKIIKL